MHSNSMVIGALDEQQVNAIEEALFDCAKEPWWLYFVRCLFAASCWTAASSFAAEPNAVGSPHSGLAKLHCWPGCLGRNTSFHTSE